MSSNSPDQFLKGHALFISVTGGCATLLLSILLGASMGWGWVILPPILLGPLFVSVFFWVKGLQEIPAFAESVGPADPEEIEKLKAEKYAAELMVERYVIKLQELGNSEQSAKQQTHRLWEVFYQLNHPAGFLDIRGTILDVNASAISLFRQPANVLRGMSLVDVEVMGGDIFSGPLERAAKGETVQFQIELPDKEEDTHLLVMSLKPVLNEQDRVELLILEGHDITERIRAEEALQETFNQFQQSQKMEAIGRLAGGIAHDFNNLLTSILGFSNMAIEQVSKDDDVFEDLQEVVQAANRAQNLTQKLLALSRKDVPDSHPIDLNQLLRDLDNLIKVTLHENLELIVQLESSPCIIQVDPTSMEQVILNLAVNARDAMPRSGRLYIKTTHETVYEHQATAEGIDAGEYVLLSIRDTGYGMDDEIIEHAFEPFFTTKESGQGTGLGLSTVYAIIQQYKGVIRLNSEPGVGTEFMIFLPKVDHVEQMMLDLPAHTNLPPLPRGDETILLVEDEEGVQRMARKMIESLGYTLISASDGEEGVEVAESYEGTIDLIVTDVVMPNLSGPEMIDRLRLSLGHIPHLYVSGFTMDKLKEHGADESEQFLIRKPYSRETLARRIRATLDLQS
ncbi:ATP-binding protein [Kiritimatiellota bacterium B12222]|nr:ATP-binding protein [Kiritimatiellota bacterium B12222]